MEIVINDIYRLTPPFSAESSSDLYVATEIREDGANFLLLPNGLIGNENQTTVFMHRDELERNQPLVKVDSPNITPENIRSYLKQGEWLLSPLNDSETSGFDTEIWYVGQGAGFNPVWIPTQTDMTDYMGLMIRAIQAIAIVEDRMFAAVLSDIKTSSSTGEIPAMLPMNKGVKIQSGDGTWTILGSDPFFADGRQQVSFELVNDNDHTIVHVDYLANLVACGAATITPQPSDNINNYLPPQGCKTGNPSKCAFCERDAIVTGLFPTKCCECLSPVCEYHAEFDDFALEGTRVYCPEHGLSWGAWHRQIYLVSGSENKSTMHSAAAVILSKGGNGVGLNELDRSWVVGEFDMVMGSGHTGIYEREVEGDVRYTLFARVDSAGEYVMLDAETDSYSTIQDAENAAPDTVEEAQAMARAKGALILCFQ